MTFIKELAIEIGLLQAQSVGIYMLERSRAYFPFKSKYNTYFLIFTYLGSRGLIEFTISVFTGKGG